MRVSVIIATYEQPAWLEKVLWGYAAQTFRGFQLVIADDGSGPATAALLERVPRELSLRPLHVWHEDRGFRKTEILNRAILAADGDYLIFTDGDCVPRADFVEAHVRAAMPGSFLGGGAFRLPRQLSHALSRHDIVSGRFADPAWLARCGFDPGLRKGLRLRTQADGRLARLLDRLTTTPARFDGGNASAWKEDLLAINGFDLDMRYGWEDRTLGFRLKHAGVRARQIRNRAVCFHLDHDRPYVNHAVLRRSAEARDRVLRHREIHARNGIAQLPPPAIGTSAVRIGTGAVRD